MMNFNRFFVCMFLLTTSATVIAQESAPSVTKDFSDGQIIKIMMAANDGEISAGKVASKKADNVEVKAFGKMMVEDHTKNDMKGRALAKAEKIKPALSSMVAKLKATKVATLTNIKARKGTDFDKAYMKSQVSMHQDLLNDLDQKLIPSVTSSKLKSFLEETKHHVEMHLTKAKEIQAKLGE